MGAGLVGSVKIRWFAHQRSALVEILDKIFRKEDVQGPIESDPELLFEPGKLEKGRSYARATRRRIQRN
jgi:hypothetical protein